MTWSGSSSVRRNTVDREHMPADTFSYAQASTIKNAGSLRSNLGVGNFTFSQSVDLTEDQTLGVPEVLLQPGNDTVPPQIVSVPARDIAQADVSWSASVNYQQQLVGSTTLTPRVAFSGRLFRADTSSLAQSFVSAPARIAVGALLKTDVYGFFPGVGPFEAIRHKFSPAFDWQWSPESTPTDLQRQVFGPRALQPQNALGVTLNQTFEARREDSQTDTATGPAAALTDVQDSLISLTPSSAIAPGGPRRLPQAQIVNLLALRTSVVRYDFVQADSAGSFLQGFQTTRLTNQISSDLLRGLSVSVEHDLFEDLPGPDGTMSERRFDPHLSQLNLSFSLGSGSYFFRWFGLFGGPDQEEEPQEPQGAGVGDPFVLDGATDEATVVPRTSPQQAPPTRPASTGAIGSWTANVSYALQRPRALGSPSSQMLTWMLRLRPTPAWELSWRTAYDIESGGFNDHSIRLTRDLHRWQANFDFLQTATGNWSFRFEVSLLDNRDLKFDYDQQNVDLN
jgi:hypothetical protein